MSTKTFFKLLTAGLIGAAGCTEEVYDSSVTERAPLRLAIEWERQDAAIPLPASYTALLPGMTAFTLTGDEPLLESLPTGTSRLLLFNVPEGMTADGSVVSVAAGSGARIGWLFTAAEDIYVRPLTDNLAGVRMRQRTRELHFRVHAAEELTAVEVELEAATRLDAEYNRLFDPAPVGLALTSDPDGSFAGTARILGLAGPSLEIRFTFRFAAAPVRGYLLRVPPDAFGGNRLPTPLTIDLYAEQEGCRAEIGAPDGHWQVELSRIAIDNNPITENLNPNHLQR